MSTGYSERLEAIVFDLDGTLIELPIDREMLGKKVRELLQGEKPPDLLPETIDRLTVNSPELRARIYQLIAEAELEATKRMLVDHNVGKILQSSRHMRLKLALVTMQSRPAAIRALEKLGAYSLFEAIITVEDASNREAQLRMALEKIGARKAVMVGDRLEDIEAGKSLGCYTVGLSGSRKRRLLLQKASPDKVLGNISELPTALDTIARNLRAERSSVSNAQFLFD